MFLKKLEVHGFKSFPDRVELEFLPGITAIVGPNGSGKSNIGDAVKWVLGEQNARALRGSKMEDIIFSGTEKRRPLGVAEVTLILDNSDGRIPLDYQEVSITRRIYRSGESEYLINNAQCRLKDIHGLFFDTGVGRDAYAIVEQGKIDSILSSKSQDRRAIFEEAAGITKYKVRKDEALRKLQDVEYNLVRVWDMMNELGVRVEGLKDQAEKAERYLKLQSELKDIEVGLLSKRFMDLKDERAQALDERHGLWMQVAEHGATVARDDAEVTRLRAKLAELNQAIEQAGQQLVELASGIERAQGKIGVATERRRLLAKERERLSEERGDYSSRAESVAARYAEEKDRLEEISSRANELRRQLREVEEESSDIAREIARCEQSIEDSKGRIVGILSEMADARNLMTESRTRLESSDRVDEKLRARLAELAESQRALEAEKTRLDADAAALVDERTAKSSELDRRRELLASIDKEIEQVTAHRTGLERKANAAESRLRALGDLDKSHEGFYGGVKSVLDRADEFKGIVGVVADLIRVPDGLEVAIEVALGSALQNIVTLTDETAKRCVDFLKRERRGRATFLPLNMLRVQREDELPEKLRNMPGILGLASKLVETDDVSRKAIDYSLARVVIAKDLDCAVAGARMVPDRYRFVTVDGEVISPGGAITGGSLSGRSYGILERKKEIERLELDVTRLQAECHELGDHIERLRKRRAETDSEIELCRQTIRQIDFAIVEQRSKTQAVDRELLRLKQELGNLESELSESSAARESLAHRISGSQKRLNSLAEEQARLDQELSQAQAQLKELLAKKDVASATTTELRVRFGECEQELKTQRSEVERYDLELSELKKRLATLEELAGQNERALEDTEIEIASAEREQRSFAQLRDELQRRIDVDKSTRTQLISSIEGLEEALRLSRAALGQAEKALSAKEVLLTRLESQIGAITERLREAYNIAPDEIRRTELSMDEPDAIRIVERLKRAIKELGPVNVDSIAEYRETKERCEFLGAQHADLSSAKESLQEVIAEIDKTSKQRFLETFEAVRKEFRILFSDLFGGGRADLSLDDPDDLLNTGIEVYAEPPGKRLQTLSLLSGGERAMTAVALLFSMMKINPSPFAILDEIDAALDDANVERFNRLLRSFSGVSQFVVITHRKGTMEAADALYGVTMEESGVSKVISVKFSEERRAG